MAEITAALVKDLREKTGAGMMDCKKALTENDGNLEQAVDWLRTKGLAAAAKKAGRVAAEGLIGVAVEGNTGALIELNAETDFVSRNDQFQNLVGTIARLALSAGGDLAALNATAYPGTGRTVEGELTNAIATIGENMNLRRTASVSVDKGIVTSYVHNATAPGMGKIGVLVGLQSDADPAALEGIGKQVAMHIAAAAPQSVTTAELDPALIEREKAVLSEQARESGKPEEIIEKMVLGRMSKFYKEVVLLEQVFVIDGESTVAKAVEAAAKDAGAPIKITAFVMFKLGEGIEKKEEDFAAEVAAQLGG